MAASVPSYLWVKRWFCAIQKYQLSIHLEFLKIVVYVGLLTSLLKLYDKKFARKTWNVLCIWYTTTFTQLILQVLRCHTTTLHHIFLFSFFFHNAVLNRNENREVLVHEVSLNHYLETLFSSCKVWQLQRWENVIL